MKMKAPHRFQNCSVPARHPNVSAACVRFGLLLVTAILVDVVAAQAAENDHRDSLIGYKLLAQSLSDESSIGWLKFMREITLHGPAKEVADLMGRISKVSKQRGAQLGKLRKLRPDVTGNPPPSPFGDAIQASAKGLGTYEMIFSDGTFDTRFMLLQAQAMRMVAVIADQTAKVDSNEERKTWLGEVSREYEALREEIVEVMEGCQAGGAASSPGS
mgnify:CR=1 FL=1|jgi:hypothetical protein